MSRKGSVGEADVTSRLTRDLPEEKRDYQRKDNASQVFSVLNHKMNHGEPTPKSLFRVDIIFTSHLPLFSIPIILTLVTAVSWEETIEESLEVTQSESSQFPRVVTIGNMILFSLFSPSS